MDFRTTNTANSKNKDLKNEDLNLVTHKIICVLSF